MPPKNAGKQALVIVINIGATTHDYGDTNGESFLDKAKFITKSFIEKKIFLQPKDEISVILLGAIKEENSLSFENIHELYSMQVPSWDMVEDVMKIEGTNKSSCWVEGLHVALDQFQRECVESVGRKTLVLLTDFKDDPEVIEQFDASEIVESVRTQEIELLAITEHSIDDDSELDLNPSQELFKDVCQKVNGQCITLEDAIKESRIYKKKETKAMPWKANLAIGEIQIPISAYVKVTDDAKLPSWKTSATSTEADEKIPVERTGQLIDKFRKVHDMENVIYGYKYGGQCIPVSEEDEEAMKYQGGKKGLSVNGFVKRADVKLEYWSGTGTRIVVPGSEEAVRPFNALVRAMAKKDYAAIVRRVYSDNAVPTMGALFPRVDVPHEPLCLVHVELIYADDKRTIESVPLDAVINRLSKEQNDAVNGLIDSMLLTNTEDEAADEPFKHGAVHNPATQHFWNSLAYRALHPNEPCPPMEEYLAKSLDSPESIKKKSAPYLERVVKLFPIEVVQPKKFMKKNSTNGKKSGEFSVNPPANDEIKTEVNDMQVVEEKSDPAEIADAEDLSGIDFDELVADF